MNYNTGTDTSQGKGQIISNINACLAVQATIRSTLGPYGGDLLLVDSNGRQTITNDGATVMKVEYSLNLSSGSESDRQ
jgi:T-complex protein 1 subunit eta